jgi:hypothetical protein
VNEIVNGLIIGLLTWKKRERKRDREDESGIEQRRLIKDIDNLLSAFFSIIEYLKKIFGRDLAKSII